MTPLDLSGWRIRGVEKRLAESIASESRALRRVADLEAAADLNSSVFMLGMIMAFLAPVAFVCGYFVARGF